ncbi:hypothetical protein OG592_41955 (plasmid) [Streptomyces avidinii]|uniref:hypothetical protein n=1 Tax=Streptomyces avidinii TaxID=1895 RepID=UPI002F90CEE6|nr:hypothetical protein OG592_41955 [Streptomyces avidinii]
MTTTDTTPLRAVTCAWAIGSVSAGGRGAGVLAVNDQDRDARGRRMLAGLLST